MNQEIKEKILKRLPKMKDLDENINCKICSPNKIGTGYCAEHSTSNFGYVEYPKENELCLEFWYDSLARREVCYFEEVQNKLKIFEKRKKKEGFNQALAEIIKIIKEK